MVGEAGMNVGQGDSTSTAHLYLIHATCFSTLDLQVQRGLSTTCLEESSRMNDDNIDNQALSEPDWPASPTPKCR